MKKNTFKKLISMFAVGTLVLGLFTGCGTKEPEVPEVPTEAVEPEVEVPEEVPAEADGLVLKTVSMFGGTDPAANAYTDILKEYEEKSGNTVQDSSDSADETWKASIVADFNTGNEPDVIFYFNGVDAAPILDKVVDLDTIKAVYPDYAKDVKESALVNMAEADGKTYAVPVKGFYEGLFVNKEMFDAAGLELPTDWDKLIAAVDGFVAQGITPFSISFVDEPHYLIEALILSAGGVEEHSVAPTTEVSSVPESWAKGLDYIRVLAEKGAFPEDAATKKTDSAQQDFLTGVSPMFIDGSWRVGAITEIGIEDKIVVLPMPKVPDGKGTGTEIIAGFSSGFYITKQCWEDETKQAAAVEFVNTMTSVDAISRLLAGGAGTPAADVPADTSAGVPLVISSGTEMGSKASGFDLPIDSRLKKGAWNEIISQIPAIAEGEITGAEVIELAMPQNKD